MSNLQHEIFISEDAFSLMKESYNTERNILTNDVKNYCDYVGNILGLKKGMSVMLVVRESLDKNRDVYFVYNQCLDTQNEVSPSNCFKNHNPTLNIDTHIFKGMKPDARNKYFKWGSKLKREGSIESSPRNFIWK